jgi:hypothetical protein
MKFNCFKSLVSATVGLVALSATGRAENEILSNAFVSPARSAMAISSPVIIVPNLAVITVSSPATPDDKWMDIKDCTYEMRARFFAGLKALESRADNEIAELTAKRAAMKSTTDTKEWDFAMKEMNDARAYLKDMGDELRRAKPENWDEDKDRVGEAWVRTQDAYDKVKHSTTT